MAQTQAINELKNGVLSNFPLLGPAMQKLVIEITNQTETADTNGHNVRVSPQFLNTLTFEQRIALLAHEVMHVAFNHLLRGKGRDFHYWNIATDAVINQMIIAANLPIPEGGVNIPLARGKSAEEMYDYIIMHQDQFKPKDENNSGQENSGNGGQAKVGSHEIWQEVLQQAEQSQAANTEQSNAQEKQFTQVNEKLKKKIAQKIMESLKAEKGDAQGQHQGGIKTRLGTIGEAQSVENWQKILKRKFREQEEAFWSDRRASKNNDWQSRVEYRNRDDKALVEVMLDTSGSVDDELLRGFLREIKNLVQNAELKVGCFDTHFYGFHSIKKKSEIDQFEIEGRGGTSFDEALTHFTTSRNQNIYKIIFTDGLDKVSETEANRRIKNLYWLVWREVDFKPCCGKVLKVDPYEIRQMDGKNQPHPNHDFGHTI